MILTSLFQFLKKGDFNIMKILHWDEMFHPSFGYQINVLSKFQAKQGHEVIVLTSDRIDEHPTFKSFGDNTNIEEQDVLFSKTYNVEIIRLPIHTVISGRVIYKRGFIGRIIAMKPDVILCHTNDTISSMWIALNYKKIGIPIVFDNHMLEMASKNPLRSVFRLFFKIIITPLIKRNNWIVIKTQNDDYVNKHLGIPNEQTPFLSFGSDTTLFYPNENVKNVKRKEHGIKDDDFVVVYTGKLTPEKGGELLAEAFKDRISENRDIVLVVVGNSSGVYGVQVEETFSQSRNRIIRFPTQKYVDLPSFYQMADLCVFPKQASLSFYDAQACALPVVSENTSINVDRLQSGNGYNFLANDVNDLRDKIRLCAELPSSKFHEMKQNSLKYITNNFDYKDIAMQYSQLLEKEVERFERSK